VSVDVHPMTSYSILRIDPVKSVQVLLVLLGSPGSLGSSPSFSTDLTWSMRPSSSTIGKMEAGMAHPSPWYPTAQMSFYRGSARMVFFLCAFWSASCLLLSSIGVS